MPPSAVFILDENSRSARDCKKILTGSGRSCIKIKLRVTVGICIFIVKID
jgi:hypothetical protein